MNIPQLPSRSIQFFLLCLVLFSTSCNRGFKSKDFNTITDNHRLIAVLPFKMVYSGAVHERVPPDALTEIAVAESKAFQQSYLNEILRSTRGGKKSIWVNIQDIPTTLSRLDKANISIADSWDMSSQDLARVLEVDAVVRGTIEKTQFISDVTSYGIDLGIQVIDIVTNGGASRTLPFGNVNNKEVRASYNLTSEEDGSLLWGINYQLEADWNMRADQLVDNINRRSARRFPYRD